MVQLYHNLMPKRVDHEQRRREITDAVVRITITGGLPAATFREVAAEAGVSVRLIQYYFGTKGDLLLATQQHVAKRATARLRDRVANAGDDPRSVLRAVLTSFIPTDAGSRENMLMFVALSAAALVDPTLARPEANEVPRALHTLVAKQLRRGELASGVKPDLEASAITAMVPGLAQSVLDGSATAEQAIKVIDYTLTRLLGRPGRRTVTPSR
jgi:TetR/AcrR family transcriptional regulator, transcriptional repressor of bet genes